MINNTDDGQSASQGSRKKAKQNNSDIMYVSNSTTRAPVPSRPYTVLGVKMQTQLRKTAKFICVKREI